MKLLTFSGGIHPKYNKGISIREPLREVPVPDTVVIPLSQHIGAPNEPVVKKGDYVEEGQVLGTSSAFISSPVHSSVSGTVKDIKKQAHPTLGASLSVIVERDKEKSLKNYKETGIDDIDPGKFVENIKAMGIVGMGGAAFPTHVKLSIPEGKNVETLIINGAECEPFLTCDHTIMTRKTIEILKGIEIVMDIIKPEKTFIAIENNKKAAYYAFQKLINESGRERIRGIKLVFLETKYPQGGEKQLIKAVTGREVPPGKLPLDVQCLVHNVGTVYAVFEAIYFSKPLMERIITISGDCLDRPGNYKVKVGTTLKDIVDNAGIGLYKDPAKVIIGGPMMGFAQTGLEAPVLKSTSGILFLTGDIAAAYEEDKCIRCAKCVDVCPVNLSPTDIMRNVSAQKWDELESLWVSDCMECGSCAYSCPARIPLVQYIKQGKAALRSLSR